MISKQEIMDFSREFNLSANIIEKDYVLGWVLAGIANQPLLANDWIFKGGTCLKKCYFETFRFSEDLDFTLIDNKHIDADFLLNCFKETANWIYDSTGIEIPTNTIRFEVYQNKNRKFSVEGKVGYIGPLQRRSDPVRIKFDLTADEILVLEPSLREVHHPYSDKPLDGIKTYCYSFPEIFAEKIRALSQRARPRDLYDVIHLYRHMLPETNSTPILNVLKKKCEYKNIPIPDMKLLEKHPKLQELETEWENMLAHQLPMLPLRENFWQELPNLFKWLHGKTNQSLQTPIILSQENIDNTWQPPSMIHAWKTKVPLELVRYAGANNLCVELLYENKKQLVEAYNLKKTLDGKLLLIGIEHNTNELILYNVDLIQRIEISQISFNPKHIISMTPVQK